MVHNPQVVEKLRSEGLEVITDVARPATSRRDHGARRRPGRYREPQRSGVEIIDTTCPIVTRSQQWAKRLSGRGLRGRHLRRPEPQGSARRAGLGQGSRPHLGLGGRGRPLPDDFPSRVGVLSQTTEIEGRFASFVKKLFEVNIDRICELRVLNTLCHATTAQQAATMHLAEQVSLMFVVGGRDSANTRHLAVSSRECGVETYHVETAGRDPGRVARRPGACGRDGRRLDA